MIYLDNFYLYLSTLNDWGKFAIVVGLFAIGILIYNLARKHVIDSLKPIVKEASDIFSEEQENQFIEYVIGKAYVILPVYIRFIISEEKATQFALDLWNSIEEWSQTK